MQLEYGPESIWHSKVTAVVVDEKLNVAEVSEVVLLGPEAIAVSGGPMTVHV